MAEIKGGELILRCLQQEGVKRIIGITDEGYHAIQHNCPDYGMRFIAPRHEAAAAHIAHGIYKASGEISAARRSSIPAGWACSKGPTSSTGSAR